MLVPPRPPTSFGHVMPAHPLSYNTCCHVRQRWRWSYIQFGSCRFNSSALVTPGVLCSACCSRNARASARNAASSGESPMSIRPPWSDGPHFDQTDEWDTAVGAGLVVLVIGPVGDERVPD